MASNKFVFVRQATLYSLFVQDLVGHLIVLGITLTQARGPISCVLSGCVGGAALTL